MSMLGVTVILTVLGAAPSSPATPAALPTAEEARRAVERGLRFLETDAVDWRKERGCATCHHGVMTIWALGEARSRGYAVDAGILADVTEWTKGRVMPRLDRPRDPRPGWNLVNQQAIYLGMMSRDLPVLSRDEVGRVAVHLARHQEDDGAWVLPPPANGAPPIWESREVVALLAYLAWEPRVPANSAGDQAGRAKAAAWLRDAPPTDSTQADALRLLVELREGNDPQRRQSRIDRLLARQDPSGGWSQVRGLPADAYATGQALYALSSAGVGRDRQEVGRAVAFLVATQQDDGSWPMTSRNHPGVKSTRTPIRNPVPITYFGSAWASLGLVRSVPPAPDTPARRQHAFDEIRAFHGTYEVDDSSPERPVVRVDLGNYEVDDREVAEFARVLQAFPRLSSLRFKSAKITDAGLTHLKALTQLRELSLQGTKVTDAGIRELREALPGVKVERPAP